MNRESERKRLVELLDNFLQEELGACLNKKLLDKFAKHLLDNGIVVPPVKVGDKVWDTEGNTWKVFAITIWQDCIGLKVENSRERHIHKTFTIGKHSIGKTVFLTREEAEKMLKGSKNNG